MESLASVIRNGSFSAGRLEEDITKTMKEDALLEVRRAILNDASMTKDLEEQIDNVTLAEQIARRPSSDPTIAHDASLPSTKRSLIISPIATRSNRIIEPILAPRPRSSRQSRSPGRKNGVQRGVTTDATDSTDNSTNLATLRRGDTMDGDTTGNARVHLGQSSGSSPRNMLPIDKSAGSGPRTVLPAHVKLPPVNQPSKLSRYQSLMADVDPLKKTRGSLTSSSDGESPRRPDYVDPVSFSSSGAAVTSFATQTPEEMNSSDSDHTEDEQIDRPIREPSSTDSSSSETEEWDSEADTHTSPSDEEEETGKKPLAQYYQVVDVAKTPIGGATGAPRPVRPPDRTVLSMPWVRRPTFSSMQFPAVNANSHPRRGLTAIPTSQSFPQDFFRMVSNPFFTMSLHDAYRQACAFKEWYENNFPDQIGPYDEHAASAGPIHQAASRTPSCSSQRRPSQTTENLSPKMHPKI